MNGVRAGQFRRECTSICLLVWVLGRLITASARLTPTDIARSPEALKAREELRDDPAICRLLEKWWSSSRLYDDRDKNAALDHEEYQASHALPA